MTPTAIDLWSDEAFLNKRLWEQIEYLKSLRDRELDRERFKELYNSSFGVAQRINQRLKELKLEKL